MYLTREMKLLEKTTMFNVYIFYVELASGHQK